MILNTLSKHNIETKVAFCNYIHEFLINTTIPSGWQIVFILRRCNTHTVLGGVLRFFRVPPLTLFHLIDCIFMDQAGSGDEFLELGHKWCMGIVHDVTSQYDKSYHASYVHRTR